jgi:chromosome segregation ATPase
MQTEVSPSSSGDSDAIRRRLGVAQTIAQRGLDQSSILECLQTKVNELLKYKEEAIDLRSQLRVAEESRNFHEAEFAFQRSEYESEIQSLKSSPRLMTPPTKLPPRKVDVDVKLQESESRSADLSERCQKWKTRARLLKKENRELNIALQKVRKAHQTLKEENAELQSDIDARDVNLDQEREDRMKIADESEAIADRLRKAEQKLSDTEQENQLLRGQVLDLTKQNFELKEKEKLLKNELKQSKSERKIQSATFQKEIQTLASDKVQLQSENRHKASQIKVHQLEIETLTAEKDSAAEVLSRLSEMDDENQRLRNVLKSQTKQKQQLEKLGEELRQKRDLLRHVEEEMTALVDHMGIEAFDIDNKWTPIIQRYDEFMAAVAAASEMKQRNDVLEKRIAQLLRERREPSPDQRPTEDGSFGSVLALVKDLRETNGKKERAISQLKFEQRIAGRVIELHSKVAAQLDELHDALCEAQRVSMRPIILSVLFARRIAHLVRQETWNNPEMLSVFGGRLAFASDVKIADLSSRFRTMSEDLVAAKQKNMELCLRIGELEEERDNRRTEWQTNNDRAAISTRKLKYLKDRMIELQEEMCVLVSPEAHRQVRDSLVQSEERRKVLDKQIRALEKQLKERDAIEQGLKEQIREMQLATEQEAANSQLVRDEFGKKDKQIEALEAVLKDKTRDVLALERLVIRQREKATAENLSINSLSAENQRLHRKVSRDRTFQFERRQPRFSEPPSGIASLVSPAFLE